MRLWVDLLQGAPIPMVSQFIGDISIANGVYKSTLHIIPLYHNISTYGFVLRYNFYHLPGKTLSYFQYGKVYLNSLISPNCAHNLPRIIWDFPGKLYADTYLELGLETHFQNRLPSAKYSEHLRLLLRTG